MPSLTLVNVQCAACTRADARSSTTACAQSRTAQRSSCSAALFLTMTALAARARFDESTSQSRSSQRPPVTEMASPMKWRSFSPETTPTRLAAASEPPCSTSLPFIVTSPSACSSSGCSTCTCREGEGGGIPL